MSTILHLITAAAWRELGDADVTNPSQATEGFIHCTDTAAVLLRVANTFYRDDLQPYLVLHIDTTRLTAPCIWEAPAHPAPTDEQFVATFPHVYGPIDRVAVTAVHTARRSPDGTFLDFDGPPPIPTSAAE